MEKGQTTVKTLSTTDTEMGEEDLIDDLTLVQEMTLENVDEETTPDEETGSQMDVLHLRMLQLMEDLISQQLLVETHTSRARLMLAKTRLQHGIHCGAAASLLPSCMPHKALCRLVEQGNEWCSSLKLLRFAVDPAKGYLLPVTHIFGALAPHSLRLATQKWERCVKQIVECVNVQRELVSVAKAIERLRWTLHTESNA